MKSWSVHIIKKLPSEQGSIQLSPVHTDRQKVQDFRYILLKDSGFQKVIFSKFKKRLVFLEFGKVTFGTVVPRILYESVDLMYEHMLFYSPPSLLLGL